MCQENILQILPAWQTFSFAALMLLHWTIHGAKARGDLIFFAFLVLTLIHMLQECWAVSGKKLEG